MPKFPEPPPELEAIRPARPGLHLALADPRLDVPLQHAAMDINYRLVGRRV